jgi:hypothetical protein
VHVKLSRLNRDNDTRSHPILLEPTPCTRPERDPSGTNAERIAIA